MTNFLAIAGLATLLAFAAAGTAQAAARLTRDQVNSLALSVTGNYFPQVDPLMLMAMVEIESSRNPKAVRVEAAIDDASVGLMQTLVGTAHWLWKEMGATAFDEPDLDALLDAEASIYFGAAYVNFLRRYRGRARAEEWIVMSYNGGPGADNEQTRHHLLKYQKAKAALLGGA